MGIFGKVIKYKLGKKVLKKAVNMFRGRKSGSTSRTTTSTRKV